MYANKSPCAQRLETVRLVLKECNVVVTKPMQKTVKLGKSLEGLTEGYSTFDARSSEYCSRRGFDFLRV